MITDARLLDADQGVDPGAVSPLGTAHHALGAFRNIELSAEPAPSGPKVGAPATADRLVRGPATLAALGGVLLVPESELEVILERLVGPPVPTHQRTV